MNERQVSELMLQSLEQQKCRVFIFEAALICVLDSELREELKARLKSAHQIIDIFTEGCFSLGMDPDRVTPGRKVVRELGFALIDAMERASRAGPSTTAQLVACECIAFAENKAHLNRELIGKCVETAGGEKSRVLATVHAEIKKRETGSFDYFHEWCRQLWTEALGVHETPRLMQQDQYRNTAGDVTASVKQRQGVMGMSRVGSFP